MLLTNYSSFLPFTALRFVTLLSHCFYRRFFCPRSGLGGQASLDDLLLAWRGSLVAGHRRICLRLEITRHAIKHMADLLIIGFLLHRSGRGCECCRHLIHPSISSLIRSLLIVAFKSSGGYGKASQCCHNAPGAATGKTEPGAQLHTGKIVTYL